MTSEFAKFTVPTVKAFLKACSQSVPGNKQQCIAHAFFSCSGDLVVCQETMQRNFFHSPSPFPGDFYKHSSSGIYTASQF